MIWLYVKHTSNVHKEQESRKNEIHLRLLCSGTKFLLPLSLKVFNIRRERHNLSILAFSSVPPTRVAPATKVSASKRKLTVFPQGRSHLNSLTFSKCPKILHALLVCDVTHTPYPTSNVGYCDISAPPACMLHLTNPCAEPKGSQPN